MALILVTNDDGVQAPGLLALKQALSAIAPVIVFAPDRNWSAAGHVKTMHKPLRVQQVKLADGDLAYTSNGGPSDCVALALLGILPEKPTLLASGINRGGNLGHDVTYSGTVTAAMEGAIFGVPSMAISLNDFEAHDFSVAAYYAVQAAQQVQQHGLPHNTLLNINVPPLAASEIKGVAITRMGTRIYRDALIERHDPRGRPYYWIGGDEPTGLHDEAGTDFEALAQGKVSVTPLSLDMTDRHMLAELAQWKF